MAMTEAAQQFTRSVAPPSLPYRVLAAIGKFLRRKPLGAFGAVITMMLIITAVFADSIAQYDPLEQSQRTALIAPGSVYWAGTDQFGRDVFSRLVYGARISLFVGVFAVMLGLIPGTALGVLSAYLGGTFDYLVQRVVDAIQAVPGIILLIAIMVVLGARFPNVPSQVVVVIALAIPNAISESRVLRGASMQVARSEYVMAARAVGATDMRVMTRHVLPNITSPIIILASLAFGQFILAEATLSFLGFGIQAPAPSWGNMLSAEGRAYMFAAPWLLWGPAIALSLVVFGANMFGDALRDVLDPRLKGSH